MTNGADMFEKIISKNVFITIVALGVIMMFAPTVAAKSPVIVRYDAQFMEQSIKINLAWQSDEPIVKIIASAGREQIIIENNIDNERTESGYSGEIDIVIPAYVYNAGGENSVYISRQSSSQEQKSSVEMRANSTSQQNEAVQYSVQLVDEINQRSALLKDKVRRIESTLPQTVQKTQPKAAIGTIGIDVKNPVNTAINTTIGLVGNIGQLPDVKNVSIKNWSENRVSFSFEATGAKGIDKIVFEVRDSHGNIANQNTISCNSEKQCSRQSESLSLSPGSYSLSVAAMDIENNSSKKVEKEFQVTAGTGSVQTQQPAQQQVMQPASPQTSTTPSSQGDDPGIVYEKE
jgi:uncharacterized small protein (DUF1192 family)